MSQTLVNELIEAGVHFGHRASRWNPKMAPYIYARKNGIHIIDIRETIRGLLRAKKPNGEPLVAGRRLTAVTDRQIHQLGVAITPLHPEAALRAAGARFEGRTHPVRDFFANHYVADGDLVTGQNQNAGPMVARLLMQRVLAKQRPASVTTDPRPAARVA